MLYPFYNLLFFVREMLTNAYIFNLIEKTRFLFKSDSLDSLKKNISAEVCYALVYIIFEFKIVLLEFGSQYF